MGRKETMIMILRMVCCVFAGGLIGFLSGNLVDYYFPMGILILVFFAGLAGFIVGRCFDEIEKK